MATRDLAAFFEDGALEDPGVPSSKHPEGKTYKVPSPDGRTGLYLTNLADSGMSAAAGREPSEAELQKLVIKDEDERDFFQMVLGSTLEEMLDDGVSWPLIQRMGRDAFLVFAVNQEFADASLESEGKAVALANRASKRAAARAVKKKPSANKGGSKSRRAVGDASTPSAPVSSPGSETSSQLPQSKTA